MSWSEVPVDIVENVMERLPCIEDVVRSGAVCSSWRSAVTLGKKPGLLKQFAPWLMLTKRENDNITNDNDQSIRSIFSLSSKKLFHLRLPQAQGRRCWGTPYGWLFTVGPDLKIHLLNPLSGSEISLPTVSGFQEQCDNLQKVAVASNPSSWTISATSNSNHLVLVTHGTYDKLAFAAPGDEVWTSVEDSSNVGYRDVIFFKGHFYAVNNIGIVRICVINTTSSEVIDFADPPDTVQGSDIFYLVEIAGDLCLVARVVEADDKARGGEFHYDTAHFEVYKFDFQTEKWLEVMEELGDYAVFVGNNTSFAISTTIYPEFKRNCIYFTDDHYLFFQYPFCDMGVYDYETQTVDKFYCDGDALSKHSRPLFFLPSQ